MKTVRISDNLLTGTDKYAKMQIIVLSKQLYFRKAMCLVNRVLKL